MSCATIIWNGSFCPTSKTLVLPPCAFTRAVPNEAARVAEIAEGWRAAFAEPLACVREGQIAYGKGAELYELAGQALAKTEDLGAYSGLTEAESVLQAAAAAEELRSDAAALRVMRAEAGWMAGAEEHCVPPAQATASMHAVFAELRRQFDALGEQERGYVPAATQEDTEMRLRLTQSKQDALLALEEHFGGYVREEYADGAWEALCAAYGQSVAAVDGAASISAVEEERSAAVLLLDGMPKTDPEPDPEPEPDADDDPADGAAIAAAVRRRRNGKGHENKKQ